MLNIDDKQLAVVILAAGKGTRMKSSFPKVLHIFKGRPLLSYPLDLAKAMGASRVLVVLGYQAEQIKDTYIGITGIKYIYQDIQLGTAHAVLAAASELKNWNGLILILCGDVPLISPLTIVKLCKVHHKDFNYLTLLGVNLVKPGRYGRLICGIDGKIQRIVEFCDANLEERALTLVNAGVYLTRGGFFFDFLKLINFNNVQKEYYFTELVEIMNNEGYKVGYIVGYNSLEVFGVNSKEELTILESEVYF